ncbi:MAG: CmpA/NrtA family ABC transporter substrate-binding protein [Gammaproteobacteria bacterium]
MPSDNRPVNLGFIPLLDAAPLLLAQELGYFQAAGLNVRLSREASWANIRDKLCVGTLQGAQLLAPMTLSVTLGLNRVKAPLTTSFVMNRNGNVITVSGSLYEQLRVLNREAAASAHRSVLTLKQLIDQRRELGMAALTFATVYPYSCHNYLLRYWLAAGGINPDHDLNLVVIPPAQMVSQLAAGRIDGFCVGEPWNQIAVAQSHGRILLNSWDIWHNAPEKVLAVHREWANVHPGANLALTRALLHSCQWLDDAGNRDDAMAILTQPHYLGFTPEALQAGLRNGRHRFFSEGANCPWPAHGLWMLSQMMRWGHVRQDIDARSLIDATFRPDIYHQACELEGLETPDAELTQVGYHAAPWQFGRLLLGADRFIDGIRFDTRRFDDYLGQFEISSLGG